MARVAARSDAQLTDLKPNSDDWNVSLITKTDTDIMKDLIKIPLKKSWIHSSDYFKKTFWLGR